MAKSPDLLTAVVSWQLGRAAIFDFATIVVVTVSAILLVRFRVNSLWLILGGALIGVCAQAIYHLG